ncbi:MAG TPA: hypothetical protein DCS93_08520 [Microscillaceae bacterium]|nr:hypothetical protein [Microscillaceae bacterium]
MSKTKNSFFLLFIFVWLWVGLLPAQSQSVVINEDFQDVTLKQALNTLSKKYKVKIAYNSRLVKGIKVTQNIQGQNLSNALTKILSGLPIGFSIIKENKILLYKKSDTDSSTSPPTTIDISGKVKDITTGELLPFANILVLGTRRGTVTNVDGFFTLPKVPNDEIILEVSYIGYQTAQVKTKPNQSAFVIQLTPIVNQLQEVVVEYQAKMVQPSSDVGQMSINPAKFASLPNLGENDIFRTLQWLPGINATNETTAGLRVRGSSPDQNLIYFDGFSIYHTDHFLGIFSAFNANAIKDIQVYKGGFPAKFGGRVSSVIDITGKSGDQYKPRVGMGGNLVSGNMIVELPFKNNSSLLIAGRRSYSDLFATNVYNSLANYVSTQPRIRYLFSPEDSEGIGTNVNFYDLNVKYTIRPTKKDVFSVSVYNGQDQLNIKSNFEGEILLPPPVLNGRNSSCNTKINVVPNPDGGPGSLPGSPNQERDAELDLLVNDDLDWGNTGVGLRWGRLWNKKFYSNIKLGYSRYYSTYRGSSEEVQTDKDSIYTIQTSASQDNLLTDVTFRWDNDWTFNHNHTLSFGLLATFNDIQYEQLIDDCIVFERRNISGTQYTLYAQDAIKPFNKLQINAGVRLTYYDINQQFYFAPRASFQYDVTHHLKLKGAWGKYYQFINQINTSQLRESGYDFWTLPDGIDIPIIQSDHFILGGTYQTKLFTIDVEAYYKSLQGLVFYDFQPQEARRKGPNTGPPPPPPGGGGGGGGGGKPPKPPKGGGKGKGDPLDLEKYLTGEGISQGVDVLLQKKKGKYTGWLGYSFNQLFYKFQNINQGESFIPATSVPHEFKVVNMLSLGNWDFSTTFVYGTGQGYRLPATFFERIRNGSLEVDDDDVSTNVNNLQPGDTPRLSDYHRLDMAVTYNFKFGKRGMGNLSISVFNVYDQQNIKEISFQELELEKGDGPGDPSKGELVQFNVFQLGFTPNVSFSLRF